MSLALIQGGGDIVEFLSDALERAQRGEFDAVAICCTTPSGIQWGSAWKEGTPAPWARLLASVTSAQHDMLAQAYHS